MNATLSIRRARAADLDALVALEQASFVTDRVSRVQYRRHLDSASAEVLVAMHDGDMAGAAMVFFRRGTQTARLYSLAVATAARGQGVGKALLEAAERVARRRGCRGLRLEVRVDNPAAMALYERAGYVPMGRREGYYEDGADALCYRRCWRDGD
ncbi:MAG TPA: ribosomal protein S18-alanine N-acetyltransferase [Rhodanobacteraceae bacterium]